MSPPSKPASSRISREDAGCAIDALLGFLRARAKQRKAQLFEHDDFIYLHLSVRRFPSTPRVNPYRIPLPHSLHPLDPSRTSLCLIVDDSLAETARSTAAAEKLPFDSVIPLSELRTDYVPFESRRRLCDSYDIFFAERRIITLLPRLIGSYFFKKKKIPLAINISRPGWPEAVRQACRSTLLFFGSGTGIGMKVGRVSMDREEIIDNLMAAIEGAVNHVPKKWANIRCMYIKAVQSVALPIYQVVPETGMKIDIGSREEAEPLDGIVVQKRDGKSGEGKEKNRKKLVGSKKRKGRIHDVDYVGGELVDGNEDDDDREGIEEQENDDLGMEKKKKKKKKDGKVKLSKGKKAVIDEDDHEEKESGDQFIKLGTGKKMRKRAKKIVNSEVEEHGIIDGLAVDTIVAADVDDHGDDKKLVGSKKRKGRIHDVDYVGCELVDGNEDDDDREGVEEQENDDLGMEKKKRKKKKDGKVKLSKGKKAVIDEDDHEEKESGDQFIKLGTGKKMRKKAKKIVNSEVEEHGIIDGLAVDTIVAADVDDHGDDKELLLKMKVKNKGKKGKKISLHASNGDQENLVPDDESNVMDGDDAIATTAANDGHHVDVDLSNVQKRVKNNEKIGNDKKVKKVKKTKLRKTKLRQ